MVVLLWSLSGLPAESRPVSIVFAGDTSFGESYHDRLASQGREPVLRTRGYEYLIELLAPFLEDSQLTILNLETPVTDRFPSPFAGKKNFLHYADPERTPQVLAHHGVDIVSLANNHSLDFGIKGLAQTETVLAENGLLGCGAGTTAELALAPVVRELTVGDQKITFALFCVFEWRDNYEARYNYYAKPGRGGVGALDLSRMRQQIETLKNKHAKLFVVAFPHWGKNYRWATETQIQDARALVDADVDLIIGHGAHQIQEVARYQGHWIVYGLGNFVFGAPGRFVRKSAPPYGFVARLKLDVEPAGRIGKTLRLYPIFIDNRQTNYQSRPVDAEEFKEVLKLLGERRPEIKEHAEAHQDKLGHFLRIRIAKDELKRLR